MQQLGPASLNAVATNGEALAGGRAVEILLFIAALLPMSVPSARCTVIEFADRKSILVGAFRRFDETDRKRTDRRSQIAAGRRTYLPGWTR